MFRSATNLEAPEKKMSMSKLIKMKIMNRNKNVAKERKKEA